LLSGTRLAAAYGSDEATEEYMCSYGVNPDFRASLVAGPLREAARDDTGDLRGVELDGHPFYVATLFQPERAALRGKAAPLVAAFLKACATDTLRLRAPGPSPAAS
jgi:CTP synthase (UTP-ammonia lyase)